MEPCGVPAMLCFRFANSKYPAFKLFRIRFVNWGRANSDRRSPRGILSKYEFAIDDNNDGEVSSGCERKSKID